MRQFDVVVYTTGSSWVVNCQTHWLDHLQTRLVIPLVPEANTKIVAARLNPILEVAGERFVLATQLASAVRTSELGAIIASLADQEFVISNALDMLIGGF